MRGEDERALAALQEVVDSAVESLGRCAAANTSTLESTRPIAPAGFAEGLGELMGDPVVAFMRRTADAAELLEIWREERGEEHAFASLADSLASVDGLARELLAASEREAREWAAEILSVWDGRDDA